MWKKSKKSRESENQPAGHRLVSNNSGRELGKTLATDFQLSRVITPLSGLELIVALVLAT